MIRLENVSKSFGQLRAVQEVSLDIVSGDFFGFLGPNGAGKSTTIQMLASVLTPDQGEIYIDDAKLSENREAIVQKIGVVPQEIALYEELSAYDNMLFWGGLYDVSKSQLKQKIDEALKMVGLWDRRKDSIKTYSGGMKRRINIACSILHSPEVLLLDEPTVGVDPQSRSHIFRVLQELNADGMTILYTTHYMEEAEQLCDTIAIIDEGQIKAMGDLQTLKSSSESYDLVIIQTSILEEHELKSLDLHSTKKHENSLELVLECKDIGHKLSNIIPQLLSMNAKILSIDTKKVNLESIFLKLTGKQLRD